MHPLRRPTDAPLLLSGSRAAIDRFEIKQIILALGIKILEENDIQVIWQTGRNYFEQYKSLNSKNAKVYDFIEDMNSAYSACDLLLARAGATTIAELLNLGIPAILVPSPNVAEDHQTHNALALVNTKAALTIKDDEAKWNLIGAAFDLLKNDSLQKGLSTNIKQMAIPNAAERIVEEILKVCSK